MRRLAVPTAVGAGTLLSFGILVALAGASPLAAGRALLEGGAGSAAALGETLVRTTPLLLCALGALVAFRSGVLNVGLDGQLLCGAAAAAAVGPLFAAPLAVRLAVLFAAPVAGALATLPSAWLAERRGVPPVLSTILFNLVAGAGITWLVRGPLQEPGGDYPQSRPLADATLLRPLLPGSRATAAILVALLLAGLVALLFSRTPLGLALRAAGLSPRAARAAGLHDARLRVLAFALSGALAGLAGGLEVLAVTGRIYDPFAPGAGFLGISAALLGNLHALGSVLSSFLFAFLGAGGAALQREAGVPAAIGTVVPALAVLAALAARAGRSGR